MIIGLSGRKQSGKSTAGNFIHSLYIAQLGISEKVYLNESGEIIISDLLGDKNYAGIFNTNTKPDSDITLKQVNDKLCPEIKLYSFADPLKQDICINMFGLTYEQCYGTDDNKNSLTNIEWKNMPGYNGENNGLMTARQVMEFIGTDIFRKIDTNVWVNATIKKINKDKSKLAIITDCRFPNEIQAIKNNGGKILRLTRNPFNSDHLSETILDQNNYDWNNFDYVIENDNYTLYDQVSKLKTILEEILQL